MDAFDKLVKYGEESFHLKISYKDQSTLMKILGVVLFFNKDFMGRYSTTIGSTVYFPSKKWVLENRNASAKILAHELVHIADSKSMWGFVFSYSYLFPQILASLALVSIFGSFLWLLFLIFLLPFPSPTRTFFELRGYAVSDFITFKQTRKFIPTDFLVSQFTTSKYYFMWPFKEDLLKRITNNRNLILTNRLSNKIKIVSSIENCFKNEQS